MLKRELRKPFLYLFITFMLISIICHFFKTNLAERKIDPYVVEGANILLFGLSALSILMHYNTLTNPNPRAFVSSVMGAAVLKLFIIAGSALAYLFLAGEGRSVYAIIAAMGLYIIYAIIEVAQITNLNKAKNANS